MGWKDSDTGSARRPGRMKAPTQGKILLPAANIWLARVCTHLKVLRLGFFP